MITGDKAPAVGPIETIETMVGTAELQVSRAGGQGGTAKLQVSRAGGQGVAVVKKPGQGPIETMVGAAKLQV